MGNLTATKLCLRMIYYIDNKENRNTGTITVIDSYYKK